MPDPAADTAVETIAAVSSPPGEGAIAIIRLSGPDCIRILGEVFVACGDGQLRPRVQQFGRLQRQGQTIDEVVVAFQQSPASYTGEDVVEVYCHGGVLVTGEVLQLFLDHGARVARPGEFTERAFLNGKMDLTRAEAVMDLIHAQTSLAMRSATEQLQGRLGDRIMEIRAQLLSLLAHVEAFIDFPDEDIDPATGGALLAQIDRSIVDVEALLATADEGRVLREGLRTVIYGEPNVGKSSLLNVLLGYDRAIVSAQPGTTRDTIEEVINLHGIPVRLTDTAGLRDSTDKIECEGMSRTRKSIELADVALHVVDAHEPFPVDWEPGDVDNEILVLNKSDLGVHPSWHERGGVVFSCIQADGMQALAEAVAAQVAGSHGGLGESAVAINARHNACLKRALVGARAARAGLSDGVSVEFVALDLREALEAVGDVIGKADVEELLGEIFSNFCIGK